MRTPGFRPSPRFFAGAACVLWGLALGGCNHPLAQRSASEWKSQRVVTDDPAARGARVRPVSREGYYALAREWDRGGEVARAAAGPATLGEVYLSPGELLGFRTTAAGELVAVGGDLRFPLEPDAGVHHVWYLENPNPGVAWSQIGLVVLTAALVVGIVALVANADQSTVDIDLQ